MDADQSCFHPKVLAFIEPCNGAQADLDLLVKLCEINIISVAVLDIPHCGGAAGPKGWTAFHEYEFDHGIICLPGGSEFSGLLG
jgi:hypothetical protein